MLFLFYIIGTKSECNLFGGCLDGGVEWGEGCALEREQKTNTRQTRKYLHTHTHAGDSAVRYLGHYITLAGILFIFCLMADSQRGRRGGRAMPLVPLFILPSRTTCVCTSEGSSIPLRCSLILCTYMIIPRCSLLLVSERAGRHDVAIETASS